MVDRLSFLISRGLGPVNNLGILTVVGIAFGKAGVADYTYAMAVCGPLYYVIGYNLPFYIAIQPLEGASRREILWVRLLTVAVSCLLAAAVALFGGGLWTVIAGLWFLKAGEVLFEPVIVFSAIDTSTAYRGRRLAVMETTRVAVVQLLLWSSAFLLKASLAVTLGVVGLGSLLVGGYFLTVFPKWGGPSSTIKSIWASLRKIATLCTPMAASGAILSAVIGMPRLLMDHHLGQDQRALLGMAQVGSSVIGLIFNALWMYDLHKLKTACERRVFRPIMAHNAMLTLVYVVILVASALMVWVGPGLIRLKIEIVQNHAGSLAYLLIIMTLPHCLGLHRDVLKLIGQSWLEVRILIGASLAGCAAWYVCAKILHLGWLEVVTAIVATATLVQFLVSAFALHRATEKPSLAS